MRAVQQRARSHIAAAAAARPRQARSAAVASVDAADRVWGEGHTSPVSCYVHLPFCKKKCHYCDFPVVAVGKDVESQGAVLTLSVCKSQGGPEA